MKLGRLACAPRVCVSARSLAYVFVCALTFVASPSGATACVDVRTGRSFTVPSARYSSTGTAITDESLLGRLCVGALRATYSVAVGDGADGAFVVWIESAGEDCDLRAQHVGGDGSAATGWPDGGALVCAARGTQTQPTTALSSDGGVWLAWKDYRDPQCSAVYLLKLSASGERAIGFPSDGLRVGASGATASDPAIVGDPSGGAWLTWQQGGSGARELRILHLGDDGSVSPGWPSDGRVVVESGQNAVRPVAAGDGAGGMMLGWVAESAGLSRLRLARLDGNGQPAAGWPSDGLELANSARKLRTAAMATDTGGTYVAWYEADDDSSRAFLTRVAPGGTLPANWPGAGRIIGEGQAASSPALALDGTGGAYLSWIGYASDSSSGDVRLVRLGGSGEVSAGWPTTGLAVTETALNERRPRLLALSDGVLVSWSQDEAGGHGTVLSAALASLGGLPDLKAAEAWPDLVRLSWLGSANARYTVLVERSGAGDEWELVRELSRDDKGVLVLEDHEVVPGEILSYRLRIRTADLDVVTGDVQVEIPAAAPLAIRGLAVQGGVLHLTFSVPSRAETRFELFDVQGRRLLRDVRQHEHAGEMQLQWPTPPGVRAGVFFARLTQAGQARTRRFVLAGR